MKQEVSYIKVRFLLFLLYMNIKWNKGYIPLFTHTQLRSWRGERGREEFLST